MFPSHSILVPLGLGFGTWDIDTICSGTRVTISTSRTEKHRTLTMPFYG